MRISEPATKIEWMNPYYQQQKCTPLTLVSGDIRFVRIFAGVRWRGGVKRQRGNRKRRFSGLFRRYVFGTLGNEANIIIYYCLSLVAFPMTPKYMTLNNPDWLFGVKFCFRAGLAGWDRATSENNCVKTNKETHTVGSVNLRHGLYSFWRYKVSSSSS